jgi:hypothetical protein
MERRQLILQKHLSSIDMGVCLHSRTNELYLACIILGVVIINIT